MKKFGIVLVVLAILITVGIGIYFIFFNKPTYLKTELPFEKDDGKLLGVMYIGAQILAGIQQFDLVIDNVDVGPLGSFAFHDQSVPAGVLQLGTPDTAGVGAS